VIVYLEYRRKSGRTISENCILNLLSSRVEPLVTESAGKSPEGIGLDFGTTFNLSGLTQRQKKSKEDVVLPHFLAQGLPPTDNARGDTAEIEYTLDAEDDFDDEEDVDEDLLI
jgi:elongator complex protein 5